VSIVFGAIPSPLYSWFFEIWLVPLSPQRKTHNESCGFFILKKCPSFFSLKVFLENKKQSHAFF